MKRVRQLLLVSFISLSLIFAMSACSNSSKSLPENDENTLSNYLPSVDSSLEGEKEPLEIVEKESANGENQAEDGVPLTPETAKEPFVVKGLVIVNKKHPLPKNYDAGENQEAVKALKELIKAAQNSDDQFAAKIENNYSGFRSFENQTGLYNNYVKQNGKDAADTFSARPGYSEHQSGFAFDLIANGNLYRISDKTYTPEEDWVFKNCAKYGFIVRYLDKWQSVTGYKGEPWHLRYVGKELAAQIAKNPQPLEEVLNFSGGDYQN